MLIFHFNARPDKQASVQCLCCVRLTTFTAQSKMTSRYLEPGILGERRFVEKEAIHEFTMLGMLYFLPEYCQTSHSLLDGSAVLHTAANTCHAYSHKEPQNRVSHNSYLTCTLHAHNLTHMSCVNEATAF